MNRPTSWFGPTEQLALMGRDADADHLVDPVVLAEAFALQHPSAGAVDPERHPLGPILRVRAAAPGSPRAHRRGHQRRIGPGSGTPPSAPHGRWRRRRPAGRVATAVRMPAMSAWSMPAMASVARHLLAGEAAGGHGRPLGQLGGPPGGPVLAHGRLAGELAHLLQIAAPALGPRQAPLTSRNRAKALTHTPAQACRSRQNSRRPARRRGYSAPRPSPRRLRGHHR